MKPKTFALTLIIGALFMMGVWLSFVGGAWGQDQPIPPATDLTQPQEAMSGIYSYQITANNILLIDVQELLLTDKLKRVDFQSQRSPKKDWGIIKPRLSKMFEQIMEINGVVDFAVTSYQFAVQIAPRFSWTKTKEPEKSMLQQTLEIVDRYIQ